MTGFFTAGLDHNGVEVCMEVAGIDVWWDIDDIWRAHNRFGYVIRRHDGDRTFLGQQEFLRQRNLD